VAEMRLDGMSLIDAFEQKADTPGGTASPSQFYYPKLGPGQMWEAAANKVLEKLAPIFLDRKVQTIHWDETGVTHVTGTNRAGEFFQQEGTNFLSSLPLKDLMLSLDPPPPKEVAEAARSLTHRAIVTVCLIINREKVFPDTWIYVPDPAVKVARVQNYKNWSAAMVPDPKLTSLGCEYYCNEGDITWNGTDYDLAQLAIREVVQIGLVKEAEIKDAFVVRMPRALPVHTEATKQNLKTIRDWVSLFANLQPLGRNGLHCEANQDHAMMTAMLAVKNIQGGDFDCWKVTPDAQYPQDSPK
jgi:protoporphyrinogen oxidase